jgi:hypothetical protein
MDEYQSIDAILASPQRKLVVANKDIDLSINETGDMYIFIFMVLELPGSAGGRSGGSGSRRIDKIVAFTCSKMGCNKFFESLDIEQVDKFEVPYSAVAIDIKLSTGRDVVVQGVVDPSLVQNYQETINHIRNL